MFINYAVIWRILDLCRVYDLSVTQLESIIVPLTMMDIIKEPDINITVSLIQKICDGLNIDIKEFFNSYFFNNIKPESNN